MRWELDFLPEVRNVHGKSLFGVRNQFAGDEARNSVTPLKKAAWHGRLFSRGKSRQKIHLQLAFIRFGADLQCFRHARLRHLARDTEIELMGFHQEPFRNGAEGSRIHSCLGVSDGMRRK